MKILEELNELVNEKFDNKPKEAFQEFRVVVKVSAANYAEIRTLLDRAMEHLKEVKEVIDVTPE
jgi:hypothetical protein